MDDLTVAVKALATDQDWISNRAGWTRLKNALDDFTDQFNMETLEILVESHRELPKVVSDISKYLSAKWWSRTKILGDGEESGAMDTIVAYMRLLKLFYTRRPLTNLEKRSNAWVQDILDCLASETATIDGRDEILALAIIMADFAPEQWQTEVAMSTFRTTFHIVSETSNGAVWTLPTVDLRKLLIWAYSVAKLQECQSEIRSLIDSLEPAKGVLSSDCLALYQRLLSVSNNL